MMEQTDKPFKLSAKKIPLVFIFLFGLFILRALFPNSFLFSWNKKNNYTFNQQSMIFFAGDVNVFFQSPMEEAEKKSVLLFPEHIQKNVKKVIRPVLILSEKYQVDPFWVLSVMWAESTFRHEVISKKGARGLMQLMPPTYQETLAEMKRKGIFLEAERGEDFLRYQYGPNFYDLGADRLASKLRHLEVGIYYLKGLLQTFNTNHYYATISYNMGPQWTRNQLKNNLPVGKKNRYLSKVLNNYFHITRSLTQNTHVTFIPNI